MLRRLRNAFLVLATLVVVGFGALVAVAHVYEDEVKAELIGALNERLDAPVAVGAMDLTLVARFPQASMRLHDVLAMEVRSDERVPDTLLHARDLFLEFSLWDLFKGAYVVQEVHGSTVRAYPALDTNGNENFLIWKADTTGGNASPIALEKMSFDDLHVRYRDDRTALEVRTHSDHLALRGRFDAALNEVSLNGDVHLARWDQRDRTIIADRHAHLRADLTFGGPDGAFRITKGELVTSDVPLEVTLALTRSDNGQVLDLRANGLGLDLSDVIQLLPESVTRQLRRYGVKGEVELAVHYSGPLEGDGPSLSVGAKVSKGRMQERSTGTTFSEIRGELALDLTPNGVPRNLLIKGFSARSGNGNISGNWRSKGLTASVVDADVHGDIALADLLRFAQIDTLEEVNGRMKADLRIAGRLRDLGDLRASDLRTLTISGTATLRDATLKMKGIRHTLTHLDADLALHGNDATVQGLKVQFQGNPITISGTLRNLMPYIVFPDQHLVIEAKGRSPRIDLAALLRNTDVPSTTERAYALKLPGTVELDLQAHVDELVFEDFSATDINGHVRMKDRRLNVSPVTFNTASGAVLGSLDLDTRTAGNGTAAYPLAIDATIKDIDITRLFQEFQDFGQDFIGHRHLSGRMQAEVAFSAPLSAGLKLDLDRLVCVVDLSMEQGAIKGHAPLLEVADHLKKNKLVAPFVDIDQLRDRLADVRFSKLENRIAIRDRAVHIPAMLVSSSVMDIELSGTHGFDDRIDHHLNFRLSDLFRRGALEDEFGPVVDDGTGMRIFLHMFGTAQDPQFENDGAMAAARRKKQFQAEKQELRSILKEELGLFKKSGGTTNKEVPAAPEFKVILEDPDSASTAGAQGPKNSRRGLGRLLKEDTEKEKVIFEVE